MLFYASSTVEAIKSELPVSLVGFLSLSTLLSVVCLSNLSLLHYIQNRDF
jgi:hypothetical protein